MEDKIEQLKSELRMIIITALNKRSDTKKIIENSYGDYVEENTDTMMEIESEIFKILE